jgi:phosphoribosylformylglycinamidine synthase I
MLAEHATTVGPDAPRALVIRTAGTNCDAELVHAFRMAGADAEAIHLDRLIERPSQVDQFDLIGFPGGFSYGDDIASGRILAMKLREFLYPALRDAAARGVPMIGVCNGFQALVQVGLLPGPRAGEPWPADHAPDQRIALCENIQGRFCDQWVGIKVESKSPCLWTRHLAADARVSDPDIMMLPVAHGEGRLVAASDSVLDELEAHGQVVLRYTDNYNGSDRAIAGVCDPSGRIFGLMPHPERYLDWTLHPYWTSLPESKREGTTPGLLFFKSAVEAVRGVHA